MYWVSKCIWCLCIYQIYVRSSAMYDISANREQVAFSYTNTVEQFAGSDSPTLWSGLLTCVQYDILMFEPRYLGDHFRHAFSMHAARYRARLGGSRLLPLLRSISARKRRHRRLVPPQDFRHNCSLLLEMGCRLGRRRNRRRCGGISAGPSRSARR